MLEKETKIDDIRSTVLVVKVLANVVFVILSLAFFIEFSTSLGASFMTVFEVMSNNFVDIIYEIFGWS